MDPREIHGEDWLEAMRLAVERGVSKLWTALPAQITEDSDGHICVAQPTIKGRLLKKDGSVEEPEMPKLGHTPVHFPSGGGFTITHPVKKGDEGILVFAARNMDAWWDRGGVQKQLYQRKHHLSDSIYIPGIRSNPRKLGGSNGAGGHSSSQGKPPSTTSVQIRDDAGEYYYELAGEGATNVVAKTHNVKASDSITHDSPTTTATGDHTVKKDQTVDGNHSIQGGLTVQQSATIAQNLGVGKTLGIGHGATTAAFFSAEPAPRTPDNPSLVINRNTAALPPSMGVTGPNVGVTLWINGADTEVPVIQFDGQGNLAPNFTMRNARGSGAIPSHTVSGDILGVIGWRGYGDTVYSTSGAVRLAAIALQDFTNTAMGAQLEIRTNPLNLSASVVQALVGPGLTVGPATPPGDGMQVGDINAYGRVMINGTPVGGGTGGIPDAVADSTYYGRYNNTWQHVLPTVGGTITGTAPGQLIVNRNAVAPPAAAGAHLPGLWANGGNSEAVSIYLDGHGASPLLVLRSAGGPATGPVPPSSGNTIGIIAWRGFAGGTTGYATNSAARIIANCSQDWSETAQGTYLQFETMQPSAGAALPATQMIVGNGVTIGTPSAVTAGGPMTIGDINAVRVFQNGVQVGTSVGALPAGSVGQIQYNAGGGAFGATDWTTSNGLILANNATSNLIAFNAAGVNPPTFTTRSTGTKIVLYPGITGSAVDYALGIAGSILWNSVSTSSAQFQWFAGTTVVQAIDGVGNMSLGGTITTGSAVSTGDVAIELGGGRTGDGSAYIDFHARASTDFDFRVSRSPGVNGNATIVNTGTGQLNILNAAGTILNLGSSPVLATFPPFAGQTLLCQPPDGSASNPTSLSVGNNVNWQCLRANGSSAILSPPVLNDTLGQLKCGGWTGSVWQPNNAVLGFYAAEAWGPNNLGTYFRVQTTQTGTTTPTVQLQVGPVGVTVNAALATGGIISSGDDILLARAANPSYLLRPNVSGQKGLAFAVQGGTPLDTCAIISNATTCSGTLVVTGMTTASGYQCRAGLGGATTGNQFNIQWPGGLANLWIDNVLQGALVVNGMGTLLTVANQINSTGGSAGYFMDDRTVGNTANWAVYAQGNFLAFWRGADRVKFDSSGFMRGTGTYTGAYAPDGTGSLLIGNASDATNYHSNTSHVFRNQAANVTWAVFNTSGTFNISGSWVTLSDRSVKDDIAPYERGLEAIEKLTPVSFRYKPGTTWFADPDRTRRFGLVAQDVAEVIPEMVGREGGIATMAPGHLVWVLVNACKELAARNATLEARLTALEAR